MPKRQLERVRDNVQYLSVGFFPINAPAESTVTWHVKLRLESWPELAGQCRTRSLRQVGKKNSVSHKAVRRAVKAVA